MKYAVLVYETKEGLAGRADPEAESTRQIMGEHMAYAKALAEAGVAAGGMGLHVPATATTLRIRNGQRQVQDGPFADTREQLGGIYVIDVPDLDAALAWASRCPSASTGCVEVRPILPPPPGHKVG